MTHALSFFAIIALRLHRRRSTHVLVLLISFFLCALAPANVRAAQTAAGRIDGTVGVTVDGGATYKIPIWVSPARAGIEPDLSLVYNSHAGNGWLGPGWSLEGLSRITRCRRTFASEGQAREVQFQDGTSGDRYCFDGQRLVVSGGPLGLFSEYGADGTEYRTEYDMQAKIVSNAPDALGPTSFIVYFKNGKVATFGGTPSARLDGKRVSISKTFGPGSQDENWIEDHSTTVRYLWALSEIRDRSGNSFHVNYRLDEDDKEHFGYDLLPTTITYAGYTPPVGSLVASERPNRSVEFVFESRPDVAETFIAGLRLLRAKRLSSVAISGPSLSDPALEGEETKTLRPDPSLGGKETKTLLTLLRRYEISYKQSVMTGRSLLTYVHECAGNGECKPATSFEWTAGDTTFTDHVVAQLTPGDSFTSQSDDPVKPAFWATSWRAEDVNGDGRDDLLGLGPPLLGNSRSFGGPLVVPPGAALYSGAIGYFENGRPLPPDRYIDINGDGIPDRIAVEGPGLASGPPGVSYSPGLRRNSIYLSGPMGLTRLNEEESLSRTTSAPPYALDLNGDGLPDLLQMYSEPPGQTSWSGWRYRLNSGGMLGPWIQTQFGGYSGSGQLSPSDPLLGLVFDPSGSGKLSLLGSAEQLLRLGPAGLELATVTLTRSSTYCEPIFMDINGDGLLDWVALGAGSAIGIAINTGNGFRAPVTWSLPAEYDGAYPKFCSIDNHTNSDLSLGNGVRVLDFDGDGRQDLLLMAGYQPGGPGPGAPRQLLVLLSNGRRFVPYPLDIPVGDQSGPGLWKQSQILDVNGDGLMDLAQRSNSQLHIFTRNGGEPDLLYRVTDGLGKFDSFDYLPIISSPAAPKTGCAYPLSCVKSGLWIVSNRASDNGGATQHTWTYGYSDGRMDRQMGEWLGFGSWSVYDNVRGSTTTITSDNQTRVGVRYPYARLPVTKTTQQRTQEVDRSSGVLRNTTTVTTYQLVTSTANSYFVYASAIEERETEQTSSGRPTRLRHAIHTEIQDSFGNVTESEDATYPMSGGQPTGSPTRTKIIAAYDNFIPSWLIGLPRSVTTTSSTPNSQTAMRTIEYDYFATTGLLWRTRVEPQTRNASEQADSGFFKEMTLTRNAYGLVTEVRVDGSGQSRVVALTYDSNDHAVVVERRNSLGHIWQREYQPGFGLVTLNRDPNGAEVHTTYDGFGRPRIIVSTSEAITTIKYDNTASRNFRITVAVDGRGVTELLHDRLGREISRSWDGFDGTRAIIETSYDGAGRIWRISVPRWIGEPSLFEVFEYDDMNRLTRVVHTDSSFTTYSYDGNTIERHDEKGNRQIAVMDERGRIVKRVQLDTGSNEVATLLEYGPFDTLQKVVDPKGNVVSSEYDQLGRRHKVIDPHLGTATALFDAFGDLKMVTDGANRTTATIRDHLGRPQTVSTSDGETTYTWDSIDNGIGRLVAVQSPSGIITEYRYDKAGHVKSSTWSVNEEHFTFDLDYDEFGRLSTLAYPIVADQDRLKLTRTYTTTGFANTVTDDKNLVAWVVAARDASGRVTLETFGNNIVTKRSFDDRGRMRLIQTGPPDVSGKQPNSVVQNLEFEWESNGNLFRRYEHNGNWAEEFHYDSLDRLTTWEAYNVGSTTRVGTTYAFDDLGNMKSRTLPNALPGQDTIYYQYGEQGASPSALTSAQIAANKDEFNYNLVGGQIKGIGRDVTYTALNLPKSITVADEVIKFDYDAFGGRILKSTDDESLVSIGELYERSTTGDRVAHRFLIPGEDRIVAQIQMEDRASDVAVRYLHNDHLGSVESVTDAEGLRSEQRSYDPFGNRQNPQDRGRPETTSTPSEIRLGFTGHRHDDETSLIDMRGRVYDPTTGHFLTADPIIADPSDGQSWNRYAYVRNNPLTLVDPSGFQADEYTDVSSEQHFGPTGLFGNEGPNAVSPVPDRPQFGAIHDPTTDASTIHGGGSDAVGSAKPQAWADDAGKSRTPTPKELQASFEKTQDGRASTRSIENRLHGMLQQQLHRNVDVTVDTRLSNLLHDEIVYIRLKSLLHAANQRRQHQAVSWGFSFEASTINPFTTEFGGVYGISLQYVPGHGFGLYTYGTPEGTISKGWAPGLSASFNLAYGKGAWTGLFENVEGGLGPVSFSQFNSPLDGDDVGYYGGSIGFGLSPTFGGVGTTTTNYSESPGLWDWPEGAQYGP